MKRFVKHLLPLGALLVVTAMPIQASAAAVPNTDLNEALKIEMNYNTQSNTYYSKLICKWTNHEGTNCEDLIGDWINNCWKPGLPNLPEITPPEKPEVPETPGKPEVPEVPEKPEIPEVPEVPEKPELPEKPDNGGNGSNEESQLGAYQQQVVRLVNKERAAAGLSPLTVNTKLSNVAEVKAKDMRDKGYFSHTSPTYGSPFDMMKQFGISYKSAGENIAKGQKTPESVMNGWMNSQGHKENILSSKYTEIGVGYVTDSKGNTYWVQMFIRP